MAKVFQNSNQSNIIGTNKLNNVIVNKDNIIESDSEFREVIKKGYLLSQINLSTVPDVITDAINEAMFNTKEAVLSDALIDTLKQSLQNLDDGIYKKTYIDNTITYLENLLTSKVNLETVASIADNKLAIALQGFATTSSVSIISSRVENSESEITNVKETINTKDTARATQIDELKVSIDDTFSGYSDAIDLYVDEFGNVKSQKIEKLELGNNMSRVSINESNEIVLDEEGNYTAITSKVILDSDGKIVGFKFTDTNAISTFKINTDVFEISNSTNSYTPFSIVGTDLLFNGKVTFSNITGGENIALKDMSNVTVIDGGKIVTNSISANKINTNGLIAENISAEEIIGKILTGGIINGARINGAVIKASYLDLDGELEVLTNYHITLAMYNANPSLYTDAIFIAADNEYRIPSLSTAREATKSITLTDTGILKGLIYSYNTANIETNNKAVKISPVFTNTTSFNIVSTKANGTHTGIVNYMLGSWFRIKLGNIILFECKIEYKSIAGQADGNLQIASAKYSGSYFTDITRSMYYYSSFSVNNTVNIGIGQLSINFFTDDGSVDGGWQTLNANCILTSGSSQFPENWDYGSLTLEQLSKPRLGSTIFSLNSGFCINNMI